MQQEIPSKRCFMFGLEESWDKYVCFTLNVFLWQIFLLVIHDIDTNDSWQKVW